MENLNAIPIPVPRPKLESLSIQAMGSPLSRNGILEPFPLDWNDPEGARRRYETDGFLYLQGVLDREQVLDFREYYFTQFSGTGLLAPGTRPRDGRGGGVEVTSAVTNPILHRIVRSPEYQSLCASPRLVAFYEWFFDSPVHLHRRKIIRHTTPHGPLATGAHDDLVYINQGTDRLCTSWIPLGDLPLDTGTLIYLEGSHRLDAETLRGRFPDFPSRSGWITRDLEGLSRRTGLRWLAAPRFAAGDMMVHAPRMIHASADRHNPDGLMRLSTDIRYQPTAEPIDPRWQEDWRHDDGL